MSEKIIKITVYRQTVTINLTGDGGGSIDFPLKEYCTFCGEGDCMNDCPKASEHISDRDPDCQADKEEELKSRLSFNSMIDGISSLVLAQAIAGIDVESPAYVEALEGVVEACGNNA